MNLKEISQDNEEYDTARQYAILHSDYEFARLILKDYAKRQLGGIYELKAVQYWNQKERREDFAFSVEGGACDFRKNKAAGGVYEYYMVIGGGKKEEQEGFNHNKRLLASHRYEDPGTRPWQIHDKEIDKEIQKIRESMEITVLGTSRQNIEFAKKLDALQKKMAICSDEEAPVLRNEINELLKREMESKDAPQEEVVKNVSVTKPKEMSLEDKLKHKKAALKRSKNPDKIIELNKVILEMEKELNPEME